MLKREKVWLVVLASLVLCGCGQTIGGESLDSVRIVHHRISCEGALTELEKRLNTYEVQHEIKVLKPEPTRIPGFEPHSVAMVHYSSGQEKLAAGAIDTYKLWCGPSSRLEARGVQLEASDIRSLIDSSPIAQKNTGEVLIQFDDGEPVLFITKNDFSR